MIYLDYNATTPIIEEVYAAINPFLLPNLDGNYGNPSSSHSLSSEPKQSISEARHYVAELLHCKDNEVIFTSGASESINHVIKSLSLMEYHSGTGRNCIISSQAEHPVVLECLKFVQKYFNMDIMYLRMNQFGGIDIDEVVSIISSRKVLLISLMTVNNETGVILPIEELTKRVKQVDNEVKVHTDASQAVGKIPFDVNHLGIDFATVAGHKMYAPKGIGVTFIRSGSKLISFMTGAGQEDGYRAGTENVPYIAGLGAAAKFLSRKFESMKELSFLRQILYSSLQKECAPFGISVIPTVLWESVTSGCPPVMFPSDNIAPHVCSVILKGVIASEVVQGLSDRVAISAGAACHGSSVSISHVLKAMGIPEDLALSTLRLSLGVYTTKDMVEQAAREIALVASGCRR